ncbi:MAG: segregation/condensation protein A, partial [archaeon]
MDNKLVTLLDSPNWKIMLLDLVNSNEFDIWNINLIKLADLYLEKIRNYKESNILLPANALLAAAILLKLKAYSLKLSTLDLQEEEPLKELDTESFSIAGNLDLNTPTRLKEGQVSLDELINIIDGIMNKPIKSTLDKKLKDMIAKEVEFCLPRKDSTLVDRIEKLMIILKKQVDSEGCALFSVLTKSTKDPFEKIDNYFMPLLFLTSEEKINIWQDAFFSEIFIKVL